MENREKAVIPPIPGWASILQEFSTQLNLDDEQMLSKKGSEEGHPVHSPEQRLRGMEHWSEESVAPKRCNSAELNRLAELRTEVGGYTWITDFILTTLGGPKVLHRGLTLSGVSHKGPSGVHVEHTLGEGTEKGKPGRCCLAIIQGRDGVASHLSSARKAHAITWITWLSTSQPSHCLCDVCHPPGDLTTVPEGATKCLSHSRCSAC